MGVSPEKKKITCKGHARLAVFRLEMGIRWYRAPTTKGVIEIVIGIGSLLIGSRVAG